MAAKKTKKVKPSKTKDLIEGVPLDKKMYDEYKDYATAMIEDRFVVGSIDGVKPVLRRALWSAHTLGFHHKVKHEKSAKVVGDTLAQYHPHGDTACYGAIVTAANSPMRTIDGKGNWGTMIDPQEAAMRYTNLRLTKYADLCFFDKFYLPTVQFIPNYDGSKKEPLNLPAMLPNLLLNGNFGIGPGVNTRIPAFTLKSVIKTLRKVLKEGKGVATPELCMGLEPTCETGGYVETGEKDVRKELREFYKTGIGSMTFWSHHTQPDKSNAIRFNRFAPMPENLQPKLDKIAALNGVKGIDDDSEASDPYLVAFKVRLNPTLKGTDRRKTLDAINDVFSADHRLDVKVTDRVMNAKGDDAAISLRSTNVPTLINDWLKYRVEAEKQACTYWSAKRQERIAYLKLLIHAINHLDHIIKSLKVDDSHAYLVKHLKITREQAETILQLRVIQLKKLEIKKLNEEIGELKKEIAGYAERIKKPKNYIYSHLETLWNELKGEAARQEFDRE